MLKRSLCLLATMAGVAVPVILAAPANATTDPYNCAVFQTVRLGANNTVVLEQDVHNCVLGGVKEAYVDEDLGFGRGGTTLKRVLKNVADCNAHDRTLSNCIRDYTPSYPDPAGTQEWWVTCDVKWVGLYGVMSEYKFTVYGWY